MPKTSIPRVHWDTIVENIYHGRCVPFLGAGVNFEGPDNRDGLPLGSEVALRLLEAMLESKRNIADLKHAINHRSLKVYRSSTAKALERLEKLLPAPEFQSVKDSLDGILREILPDNEKEEKLAHIIFDETLEQYIELTRIGLEDLARVSLRYRMNKDLEGFINKLKEIIPDADKKPSYLLRSLAGLWDKFGVIVTTNYDRLMERAMELLSASDIGDPTALAVKIKTDKGLIAQGLWEVMSKEAIDLLEKYDVNDPAFSFLPQFWADELNQVIQDRGLYQLEHEGSVTDRLTEELISKITDHPENNELVRRNRLILEQFFEGQLTHDKKYQTLVQPINGFKGSDENTTRKALSENEGLILYKLHGTFSDSKPTKETRPVITDEDYIEFLTFVGADGEGIDNQIKEKIKDNTLLFLGYSLEDWNFRALFKGLVEKVTTEERPISFAIQWNASEFWVKFWETKNVKIFNEDLHDFAEDLQEYYRAFKKQVEAKDAAKHQAKEREREERRRARHATRTT